VAIHLSCADFERICERAYELVAIDVDAHGVPRAQKQKRDRERQSGAGEPTTATTTGFRRSS
ncbi:MAG: hypothetical protein ACRDKL_03035, partial [Solirubrobacteraceae bacterium]